MAQMSSEGARYLREAAGWSGISERLEMTQAIAEIPPHELGAAIAAVDELRAGLVLMHDAWRGRNLHGDRVTSA